jgi:hypothetical protein
MMDGVARQWLSQAVVRVVFKTSDWMLVAAMGSFHTNAGALAWHHYTSGGPAISHLAAAEYIHEPNSSASWLCLSPKSSFPTYCDLVHDFRQQIDSSVHGIICLCNEICLGQRQMRVTTRRTPLRFSFLFFTL